MSANNLAEQNGLGYWFSPPRRQSEPGYSRLDIVLREIPTEKHFDPEQVRVIVALQNGGEYRTIEHPWSGEKSLRICAGPIDIMGQRDKRLEVFTFGGDLSIDVHERATNLIFTSPAPILKVRTMESEASLLAQEAEILIAERSAALEKTPGEFDRRLISANPIILYRAILHAILIRFQELHGSVSEAQFHLRHVLSEEARYLEETLNLPDQGLEQIL